jgi:hypothetical protein
VNEGILTIESDGRGTEQSSDATGGELDTLALSLAPGGRSLTATITAVKFLVNGGPIPTPPPGWIPQRVGDSFRLTFAGPHLLKRTFIKSGLEPITRQFGNPYWCGPGLKYLQARCGA